MMSRFIAVLAVLLAMQISALKGDKDTGVIENLNSVLASVQKNSSELGPLSEDEDWKAWIAPENMLREFPIYIAGYDHDKRPVVINEFGHWDIRKYTDESEESRRNIWRYIKKLFHRLETVVSPYEDAEDGLIYVIDAKDFRIGQLTSPETIKVQLWSAGFFNKIADKITDTYIINTNFVAQSWLNLVRPVGGRWIAKAELLSPGEARTKAFFNKLMPSDQIPPWFGGLNKDYKPVAVHLLKYEAPPKPPSAN